jgi:hypothetical protein
MELKIINLNNQAQGLHYSRVLQESGRKQGITRTKHKTRDLVAAACGTDKQNAQSMLQEISIYILWLQV